MCDYSLQHVKSRRAKIGDQLTTRDFGMGTGGFSAPEDKNVAVCVLPGTELSFAAEVRRVRLWPWHVKSDQPKNCDFPTHQPAQSVCQSRRAGVPGWADRAADILGRGSARHRSSAAGDWGRDQGSARFRPSSVLARISSRSNSASPPSTVSISLPCAVVVSAHASASDLKPAPAFATASSTLSRSRVERASRSSRVTSNTSPAPRAPMAFARAFLSVTAPLTFSAKTFSAPAAASAAC